MPDIDALIRKVNKYDNQKKDWHITKQNAEYHQQLHDMRGRIKDAIDLANTYEQLYTINRANTYYEQLYRAYDDNAIRVAEKTGISCKADPYHRENIRYRTYHWLRTRNDDGQYLHVDIDGNTTIVDGEGITRFNTIPVDERPEMCLENELMEQFLSRYDESEKTLVSSIINAVSKKNPIEIEGIAEAQDVPTLTAMLTNCLNDIHQMDHNAYCRKIHTKECRDNIEYRTRLAKMSGRIEGIIRLANACHDAGIPMYTGDGNYGHHPEQGHFLSDGYYYGEGSDGDGWSYGVWFPSDQSKEITELLCMDGDGYALAIDAHSDVSLTGANGEFRSCITYDDELSRENNLFEIFFSKYDKFEQNFTAYVDKYIDGYVK